MPIQLIIQSRFCRPFHRFTNHLQQCYKIFSLFFIYFFLVFFFWPNPCPQRKIIESKLKRTFSFKIRNIDMSIVKEDLDTDVYVVESVWQLLRLWSKASRLLPTCSKLSVPFTANFLILLRSSFWKNSACHVVSWEALSVKTNSGQIELFWKRCS